MMYAIEARAMTEASLKVKPDKVSLETFALMGRIRTHAKCGYSHIVVSNISKTATLELAKHGYHVNTEDSTFTHIRW